MDSTSPIAASSIGPSSSASYLLLTTSPSLAPVDGLNSSTTQRARSQSAQPNSQHPRFLPVLLIFALLDLALVCGYGLPVALKEKGVWVSEAVGLLRVAVMAWVALAKGAQRKKGAVMAIVLVSFLLVVYKVNEQFQRHKFNAALPPINTLLPTLLPPNAFGWYCISFAMSVLHFVGYCVIVGVHNRRSRRWPSSARERRQSVHTWRGREESVRIDGTPRFGPTTLAEGDIPSLSEEEDEGEEGELFDEDENSEDEEESSSEDEEDIIDMPRSGAASIRHRASRASLWREGDEEQQSSGPRMMPRSVSRRSGLGEGQTTHTTYGSFGGI